jgi:hypothetical protein
MRIHTETELEVFNELVRELSLVGLTAKIGECQFLVLGAGRFKPVALSSADKAVTNQGGGTHVKVESRPPSRAMGPPTMIVVWNPKSRSIFAHKFVSELLNFGKFLKR